MVFLIQNTQNRDTLALQLKLDELIIAAQDAENKVAVAEDMAERISSGARTKSIGPARRRAWRI